MCRVGLAYSVFANYLSFLILLETVTTPGQGKLLPSMLINRTVFDLYGLVADDGEAKFTTNMDGIAPTPKAISSNAPNFVIPGRSVVCMFCFNHMCSLRHMKGYSCIPVR